MLQNFCTEAGDLLDDDDGNDDFPVQNENADDADLRDSGTVPEQPACAS